MTITADIEHVFRRTAAAVPMLRSIDRHLAIEEDEALRGGSGDRGTRTAPALPKDGAEPPTGRTDPTGDIAISGRLSAIRARRKPILDALKAIDKALDHLDRASRAAISTTPSATVTRDLCAGPGQCSRHKEPGSDLCLECGAARDRMEREEQQPMCGWCPETNQQPVESYRRADGTLAYRYMRWDGTTWQPSGETVPSCRPCRDTSRIDAA